MNLVVTYAPLYTVGAGGIYTLTQGIYNKATCGLQ